MEVILKKDVDKLGYKDDVVKVKPGYARNYLIPEGIAIMATPSNKKMLEENLRQAAHKIAKVREDAEKMAAQLEKNSITITVKTGTSGKIFGSVTTLQIAQKLEEAGFDIDRKKISLPEEIKSIGEYHANIQLHKDVIASIPITIEGENAMGEKIEKEESKAEKQEPSEGEEK